MDYIGLSCGFHDAAVSVIDSSGNIVFAGHSERYSKNKHDDNLCGSILTDALQYTENYQIHYYERPVLKYLRQLVAGQKPVLANLNVKNIIGSNNMKLLGNKKVYTHNHHLSHAAAGFQTSPFDDATVVIIDAIGEFDTITIWHAEYDTDTGRAEYKKLWSQSYPHSIGLFYSAMTDSVGLRPLDEEYILMGMAAYGSPKVNLTELIADETKLTFNYNLHKGIDPALIKGADQYDIAASSQALVETLITTVIKKAKQLGRSDNLVYGGGVALNCSANRLLGEYYNNIWIMPNPGDAGSSLGAAALGYRYKIKWEGAFLGHDISGPYPVDALIKELYDNKIVGVASGRAEFGPRALGNRSLLADPRGPDIKDKVNEIKRRQKFRPFAPVVLEELADMYFDMPSGWSDSRYMQSVATCRYPDLFPAIVHADRTSRVQTVPKDGSGIRKLLEKWYALTGCPMLLNTSLNIRGEPMVNDRSDADRFEIMYGITVCS
jgi:carbamoyltransferase